MVVVVVGTVESAMHAAEFLDPQQGTGITSYGVVESGTAQPG